MPTPDTVSIRSDVWRMRCRFNRGHYYERYLKGEFSAKVRGQNRTPRPDSGQAFGSKTLEVRYFNKDGVQVARVHQFVDADGRILASGQPDPKELANGRLRYRKWKEDIPPTGWRASPFYKSVMKVWGPIDCFLWWIVGRDSLRIISGAAEFTCPTGWTRTIRIMKTRLNRVECDVDINSGGAGHFFRVIVPRRDLPQPTPQALLPLVRDRAITELARDWPRGIRHTI